MQRATHSVIRARHVQRRERADGTVQPVRYVLPQPEGLDSIIYVEQDGDEEKIYWRSRAVFMLSLHLQTGWRALSWFRFVPSFLADLVYRLIAKLRYKVWGKLDSCRIPTPDERARFLP